MLETDQSHYNKVNNGSHSFFSIKGILCNPDQNAKQSIYCVIALSNSGFCQLSQTHGGEWGERGQNRHCLRPARTHQWAIWYHIWMPSKEHQHKPTHAASLHCEWQIWHLSFSRPTQSSQTQPSEEIDSKEQQSRAEAELKREKIVRPGPEGKAEWESREVDVYLWYNTD